VKRKTATPTVRKQGKMIPCFLKPDDRFQLDHAGGNIASPIKAKPAATGDFNGDGIPDFVTPNYFQDGGSPTIFLGKGDGTFTFKSTSFTLAYFPYFRISRRLQWRWRSRFGFLRPEWC
jgi:FG-GAP-like repeat